MKNYLYEIDHLLNMSEPTEDSHLFKGRIKEYEQELVEFFMGIGATKSASETFQTVLAYLSIHQSLTQRQIKDLTGFSSGTISNALKVLSNPVYGILTREDIPGKQEKIYHMKHISEMFQQATLMSVHLFTGLNQGLEKYLEVLDIHREEKGYLELSSRIIELLESFEGVLDMSNEIIEIFNPDI